MAWFFFSYNHETYKNSRWLRLDKEGNFLEAFFDELCRQVSDLVGEPSENVACRDQDQLQIGDIWGPRLVEGLQQSHVLVSVLSPQYMKSESCGREIEFFRQRNSLEPPRIIPIFWIDSPACLRGLDQEVVNFISTIQLTQQGVPEDYPSKGLCQFYRLGQHECCMQLCKLLAHRIFELGTQNPLPILNAEDDFDKLPSAFVSLRGRNSSPIADGPKGTNIFYAVGTAEDMKAIGYQDACEYGEKPQDWKPFIEHPGATIEIITQEGLNAAKQDTYCDLGLPQNLLEKIEQARKRNSPVLIILDRHALQLERFKNVLRSYDERNYYHVGLVTAGGTDISDEILAEVCVFKFVRGEEHHIWEVPTDRSSYVLSVTAVVRGIRQKLQRTGTPVTEVSLRRKPVLDIQPGV